MDEEGGEQQWHPAWDIYHLDSAVRQNATSNSGVLNNNTLGWQQKPLFCTSLLLLTLEQGQGKDGVISGRTANPRADEDISRRQFYLDLGPQICRFIHLMANISQVNLPVSQNLPGKLASRILSSLSSTSDVFGYHPAINAE